MQCGRCSGLGAKGLDVSLEQVRGSLWQVSLVLALRVVRVWLGKAWTGPGRSELGAGAAPHCHRQAQGTGLWSSSSFPACAFVTELQETGAVLAMKELLSLWKNSPGRSWHGLELLLGGAGPSVRKGWSALGCDLGTAPGQDTGQGQGRVRHVPVPPGALGAAG